MSGSPRCKHAWLVVGREGVSASVSVEKQVLRASPGIGGINGLDRGDTHDRSTPKERVEVCSMLVARLAPLLLCASRPAWPGLCCMRSDGATARYGQSSAQLERNSVEWMCVDTRPDTAADALRHARAGLVEHGVVWRHESSSTAWCSSINARSRTPPPAMCELEEMVIPPVAGAAGDRREGGDRRRQELEEAIPPVRGPPGDLQETALELEQVPEVRLHRVQRQRSVYGEPGVITAHSCVV